MNREPSSRASKARAPLNRTITLSDTERRRLRRRILRVSGPCLIAEVLDRTILGDALSVLDSLPARSVDLVFADPPYNIRKVFGGGRARVCTPIPPQDYELWLDSWIGKLPRLLKPTGSLYICGDWRSSGAIQRVVSRHFAVRNRITWEREKGRGARRNWKNASEDLWFATVSERYTFRVDAVKLKRRVIAPYTDASGAPKDWRLERGVGIRLTHPSNLWTDLTVPFWSMPENTDHPTQKPEKLLAKVILASSGEGDVVLDPFLGSGTTSVVAKKLGRRFIGIEIDEEYCEIAEKRIELAARGGSIQGYAGGVFWERNSSGERAAGAKFGGKHGGGSRRARGASGTEPGSSPGPRSVRGPAG